MNFGLSIIVAFAVVYVVVGLVPIIPYMFGGAVAILDSAIFPLYYLGASCTLLNTFSTYVLGFLAFWLLIKIYKQFLV